MLSKEDRKLKKAIEMALHWAEKIYKFRCDALSTTQCEKLLAAKEKLISLNCLIFQLTLIADLTNHLFLIQHHCLDYQ